MSHTRLMPAYSDRDLFRSRGYTPLCFFISHARKPQAFKPGDEWHPFGASQVEPGEAEQISI
jgi:hypothetical protein